MNTLCCGNEWGNEADGRVYVPKASPSPQGGFVGANGTNRHREDTPVNAHHSHTLLVSSR